MVPEKVLTEAAIKAAKPPETGTITLWDASLKNFGLRISQGGTKSFIILIASGRRQSLGRWPLLSLGIARAEAKRILAEKTLGRIRPLGKAFDDAKKAYLTVCEKRNKPRTVKDYTRLLNRHYQFGRKSVGDIKPQELVRLLSKLDDTPSEKHHAFVAGRAFFRWCAKEHIIDRSPMENMEVPSKNASRKRVLSNRELVAVLKTALSRDDAFSFIVALLCLTGQRRGETAKIEWEWIDTEEKTITFPSTATKNGTENVVPYGNMLASLFERIPNRGKYLFPASRDHVRGKPTTTFNGWGKAKESFDKKLKGVAPYTLHDLRRTFSSGLASLGVDQHITERLLNHVTGANVSEVAAIYNRYQYMAEKRGAMTRWEMNIKSLLDT